MPPRERFSPIAGIEDPIGRRGQRAEGSGVGSVNTMGRTMVQSDEGGVRVGVSPTMER